MLSAGYIDFGVHYGKKQKENFENFEKTDSD